MSIKETLQHDLTEAIRSRDELTSGTIRMVLTAITTEEVAGKAVSYTHLTLPTILRV